MRHLLVVPHGPLASLPLHLLVTSPPPPDASSGLEWLARSFAVTTLPAVTTLRALRRTARPSAAGEPFRGIGDPALGGGAPAGRGLVMADLYSARGLGDVEQLRALPPLPEAADELRTLAAALGADERSLLLGRAATETAVKAADLAGARVIAFATHAVVAGELEGLAEPAIVLTPPEVATEQDDGLLTASEVAQLKLDADFVLLSACNTAAPDGTPGASGLSGLAKAFVYAGTRSLLVSHWAVYSAAAEQLTTRMFAELAREPGLGRAEALRRSMLALIDGGGRLAHPAAWAPFVVVGEGGAAARRAP